MKTKNGLESVDSFFKKQKNFLIDRGDLSKDIGIENIPIAQRKILKNQKNLKYQNSYCNKFFRNNDH